MAIKDKAKTNLLIDTITRLRTSQLFWILSFTFLTSVAAQITIPFKPVPFTLQTMMVILAGALLGPRNGAYSQIIYLAVGAIGLPVFAHTADLSLGFARLFGPTGGYLLAFPVAAFVVGFLVQRYKSYIGVILSMFAGSILIIISGTIYLNLFYLHNLNEAIAVGAALFTFWMAAKVFVAASIYFGISKRFETLP